MLMFKLAKSVSNERFDLYPLNNATGQSKLTQSSFARPQFKSSRVSCQINMLFVRSSNDVRMALQVPEFTSVQVIWGTVRWPHRPSLTSAKSSCALDAYNNALLIQLLYAHSREKQRKEREALHPMKGGWQFLGSSEKNLSTKNYTDERDIGQTLHLQLSLVSTKNPADVNSACARTSVSFRKTCIFIRDILIKGALVPAHARLSSREFSVPIK